LNAVLLSLSTAPENCTQGVRFQFQCLDTHLIHLFQAELIKFSQFQRLLCLVIAFPVSADIANALGKIF
jgi:hypothetical protein